MKFIVKYFWSNSWSKIISFLLTFLIISSAVNASGVLHYKYTTTDDQKLEYWFGGEGVRIDFEQGQSKYSVLYQTKEDALINLLHNSRQAVKLNRSFLRQMIARMRQMRKRLKNLPPRQRKMMKDSMGQFLDGLKNENNVTTPGIINRKNITWKDRPATIGQVQMGDDTSASVILLKEAPISLNQNELNSVNQFQDLMKNMLKVVGTIANSLQGSTITSNQSFHLFGDRLLRLAEFRSGSGNFVLTSWDRTDDSSDIFQVPDNYSVKTPEASPAQSMKGRNKRR